MKQYDIMKKIKIIISIFVLLLFSNEIDAKQVNLVKDVDLSTFSLKYEGTIDKRLHISIFLNQVDDKISGIYYYDKNKQFLTLDGTIGKAGHCIMFENNAEGKITGKFEGVLNDDSYKGTWKNAKNTKELSFELVNQATLKTVSKDELPAVKSKSRPLYLFFIGGLFVIAILLLIYLKNKTKPASITESNKETVTNNNPIDIDKLSSKIVQDLKDANVLASKESLVLTKDEINKKKGDDFEKHVVDKFAKLNNEKYPDMFKHVTWQGDKVSSNGNYAKTNGNPDLIYEFKKGTFQVKFAVECKYRKKDKKIKFAEASQIKRYNEFSKSENMDVYIVLGVGSNPNEPDEIFTIPLNEIKDPEMDYDLLVERYLRKSFYYDCDYNLLNPTNYQKQYKESNLKRYKN